MAHILWLLLLFGSASLSLRSAPEKLQPWTTVLREQQPEDAFAAVYRVGSHRLVFVAARHENRIESLTFRTIREAYAMFKFDTVIAEGFPNSWGANPARIFEYVERNGAGKDGFVEGGETVPTALGARQQGAALLGGEADDLEIKQQVLAQGFSTGDLLGFYVLRTIPQWIREQKIKDAGDSRLRALVGEALARNRERLKLGPDVLAGFSDWAAWYQGKNGRPIGGSFRTEEVGPLADGTYGTNKLAYAVSRARDTYLHELVIAHLNGQENVLVVFGGSHLMIHRPALDPVLGAPCYVGADIKLARTTCR